MKYVLLLLGFLLFKVAHSQGVYPLHPSVGDTIDVTEKLDYSLFPKVENEGFQYAVIVYKKDHFVILAKGLNVDGPTGLEVESEYEVDLTQEEIIEEQQKIQKINAYYKYLAEEESKPKNTVTPSAPQKTVPLRLEGAMSEKMKKEARMNIRLQEDSRRAQEFEMGLRPREMNIELFNR